MILSFCVIFSSAWYLPNKDAVWLYTKDTNLDFFRYENYTLVNKLKITEKICENKNKYSLEFNIATLSNREVDIICENLKVVDFNEYSGTLKLQWNLYLLFVIPFLYGAIANFFELMRLDRVVKLIRLNIIYGPQKI